MSSSRGNITSPGGRKSSQMGSQVQELELKEPVSVGMAFVERPGKTMNGLGNVDAREQESGEEGR